jgi:hypothetical protein
MESFVSDINAQALAIAGGAIAAALIDALHDKGILDLMEARAILDKAMHRIGPVVMTPEGGQASRLVADMLKTKYSARG